MNNCKHYNKELGYCKLHSSWKDPMPILQPCIESPCGEYAESGCDFCRENWADKTWGEGGAHDFRLSQNTLYYYDYQFGWEGMDVKHCPICGRELEEQA